ncbi:outer membrane receptor protein involved in Fe transport [Mucilaginibacter yixingensis]|uniref:Outer membrane receptor protein involved in Fe transport n=2 Tax=Mucilaginibacter yixingensis TaxID=1295612 RepID=A0A2T5J8X0_9SPHI|nr:outer membrane receptor protein involved in Fe transport [Mucilaginibacter yixingensis]
MPKSDFCGMNCKPLLKVFSIIFLFGVLSAQAQTNVPVKGAVSGKLVDAASNQPLAFATAALIRKADNTAAKSIQTDMDGNFKLDNLADGLYLLRTTYVGYGNYVKDSIYISPKKKIFQLGLVKMKQAGKALKEVTVKAQRSNIQLGVDRKVFNVEQSLVSAGGSATDLLSNVPSVQVDVDGNLNLRGSSDVRVLINGKPSMLAGASMADILQSIPASSIETIEVITNPSSKYDAEGQSGIVNIVLKKNARVGTNGNVAVAVGNQHTYNVSAAVAHQGKNVNLYANYSYRDANRNGNGYTNRTSLRNDTSILSNQISNQAFTFNSHNIRAGIDISLDPKTTLSFSGNGNFRQRDKYQFGNTNTFTNGVLTQTLGQNNQAISGTNRNLDFNADFDHKYKKQGEELTANIGYSSEHETSNDSLRSTYNFFNPASIRERIQHNNSLQKEYNINLQADYTLPLSHNNKIEAGYRSTFSQNDNGNDVDTLQGSGFVHDGTLTNHFLYKEQVHAVYGTYQQQFGQFGVQGGVRMEEAIINTMVHETGEPHHQDYFRVYPSLFLTDKLNDNQTLQLSYTRRVSRPRDRQINAFLDKSDPLNWQTGNPLLKPEDTHSMELSYINYWKALTLTSSLYYRLTNDDIQQIRTPITSTISSLTYQNIKNSQNSGFELIAKVDASQALDFTANVNAYYRYLQGDASLKLPNSSGFAWNANLTANIKPTKALGVQLRGDYQAPQVITQGRQRAMAGMDAGLKYDLTKAISLGANVRDVFNSRKFGSITDIVQSPTFSQHSESVRRFQTRTILFTASYRFGSTPGQRRNRNKDKKDQDNGGGGDDMGQDQGGDGGMSAQRSN